MQIPGPLRREQSSQPARFNTRKWRFRQGGGWHRLLATGAAKPQEAWCGQLQNFSCRCATLVASEDYSRVWVGGLLKRWLQRSGANSVFIDREGAKPLSPLFNFMIVVILVWPGCWIISPAIPAARGLSRMLPRQCTERRSESGKASCPIAGRGCGGCFEIRSEMDRVGQINVCRCVLNLLLKSGTGTDLFQSSLSQRSSNAVLGKAEVRR
jgi:hypothetical protein